MEPNPSVIAMWPLAAMEAGSSGWNEIEPAHLLCAALKFAELPEDELKKVDEKIGQGNILVDSLERLIQTLIDDWGIEVPEGSKGLRRALRRRGPGECKHDGGMLHRSSATTSVFTAAEETARQRKATTFGIVELAQAALKSDDEWISKTLEKLNIRAAGGELQPDDQWAELVSVLRQVESKEGGPRAPQPGPVVHALFKSLSPSRDQPCLLVHESGDSPASVMLALSLFRPTKKMPFLKVLQVDSAKLIEKGNGDANFSLSRLISWFQARNARNEVLFLDSLHRFANAQLVGQSAVDQLPVLVKGVDGRFVLGIKARRYRELIEKNPKWAGVFHVVWVHAAPNPRDADFEL